MLQWWLQCIQMWQPRAPFHFTTFFFNLQFFHHYYWGMIYLWLLRTKIYSSPSQKETFRPSLPCYPLTSQSSWTKCHCKQCNQPKNTGKRAVIRVKLGPKPVPLYSLLLAEACWQENGMEEVGLRLTQQQEIGDYCAQTFAETWFHCNNWVVPLDGWAMFHVYGTQDSSGTGGGLCVYISDAW